jgi:hypothetical protein
MRTPFSEFAGRMFSDLLSKAGSVMDPAFEDLHPRAAGGRFGDKPSAEQQAAQAPPSPAPPPPPTPPPPPKESGKQEQPAPKGGEEPRPGRETWDDYKKTPKAEGMKQANYADIAEQMKKNLTEIRGDEPVHVKLEGKFGTGGAKAIASGMRRELETYSKYLSGDATYVMSERIRGIEELLTKHESEFRGMDAEHLQRMMIDSMEKMAHQEIESNRLSFNDHGIRHIGRNIEMQNQLLDSLEEQGVKVTGKDRLMAFFIQVNHDVGYTTPFVREGRDFAFAAAEDHSKFSAKIAEEQRDLFNKDKVFSSEEYDHAMDVIKTHDSTEMDIKDPVGMTARLADNLSLFQKEKLPSFFKYVDGSKDILVGMGKASCTGKVKGECVPDKERFEILRDELNKKIEATPGMSQQLKRDLAAGVKTASFVTPKFVLGSLAGEVSSVRAGTDAVLEVNIDHNKDDAFLQSVFNMGQKQTKKLLEAYGIKDFEQDEYHLGKSPDGRSLLKIKVHRGPK